MTSNSEQNSQQSASATQGRPGVLLDLDGTLVDSVYQHVVAWFEAFREGGYDVPQARIHAGIGMGGDRLVPWLLGGHVDDAESLADDHKRRFLERADGLRATTGARELLADLETREVPYAVATSAGSEEREALLAVLGRDDLPLVDSEDVASSKPAPDLLLAACREQGFAVERTVMVGDAPWDALAAAAAGCPAIAVRCGGFGDDALAGAGAGRIVDDPAALIGQL
jgi:HAD superfamily hydrolase (TIGR01509 family)